MPEMTGRNIVQLICSDKLDLKSKEIEFPTKNTGRPNKRPLLWLDWHWSAGQSGFWLNGSCCAFKNPTKVCLVTLWHAKTIHHNLFTWRLGCLCNNTGWIMQMLRDEPLVVQPVPPDPWLWNALLHSPHVWRPSTILADTVCVTDCCSVLQWFKAAATKVM